MNKVQNKEMPKGTKSQKGQIRKSPQIFKLNINQFTHACNYIGRNGIASQLNQQKK